MAGREMYRAGRKWSQGISYAPIGGRIKPEAFAGDPNFSVEVVDADPTAKKEETKKVDA